MHVSLISSHILQHSLRAVDHIDHLPGVNESISCEQAGGGRGRGRGRGRGPGKWTAASPSADFLASLRPVPNQAPGSQGSRPPPIILGPVAPPPVPMTLGNALNRRPYSDKLHFALGLAL